ncbi:MAG: hypothetical protein U0Y68_12475 [Blastocatellia bacterium]
MYTLIRTTSFRQLLTQQVPILALSLLLAELFYKFHSFTLEAGAFLATWFVLDYVVQMLVPQSAEPATRDFKR